MCLYVSTALQQTATLPKSKRNPWWRARCSFISSSAKHSDCHQFFHRSGNYLRTIEYKTKKSCFLVGFVFHRPMIDRACEWHVFGRIHDRDTHNHWFHKLSRHHKNQSHFLVHVNRPTARKASRFPSFFSINAQDQNARIVQACTRSSAKRTCENRQYCFQITLTSDCYILERLRHSRHGETIFRRTDNLHSR